MRTSLRITISVLALIAISVPAAASARTTWVVNGAGNGHGVGMSSYGALGYGKHGAAYKKILRHYFRGIEIKKLRRAPEVRVLIAVDSRDVSFSGARRACGRRLRPAQTYAAHRNDSGIRLLSARGPVAGCGKRLHAKASGQLRIAGRGSYRGALVLVSNDRNPGSFNVINEVGLDNYAKGVLPEEIFPSWPKATLRAFAVAARSIALTTDVGGKGFDLYSDSRTQLYGGAGVETGRTNRAVRATAGRVATYRGEFAQTTYFSASGGRTESGFLGAPEVPYLQSVNDPYDRLSPMHRWRFRFSQAEMDARLDPYMEGSLRRIEVTKRGDSPRIDAAKLIGTGGSRTVTGTTIQSALGLYDRWAFFKRITR